MADVILGSETYAACESASASALTSVLFTFFRGWHRVGLGFERICFRPGESEYNIFVISSEIDLYAPHRYSICIAFFVNMYFSHTFDAELTVGGVALFEKLMVRGHCF